MKHRIIAQHMGHGEVEVVLEAENTVGAFAKWKQIVGNPRQWNLRSNTAMMDSDSLLPLTETSIKENDDNDDANTDRTSPTDVELQNA
jgi:hypothetical protein